MAKTSFIERISFANRREESERILKNHPTRIPIVLQSKDITLEKEKYLVPSHLTMGQFLYFIRKRVTLGSETGLFIYIEIFTDNEILMFRELPSPIIRMNELYERYKHIDSFMYMKLEKESTFG